MNKYIDAEKLKAEIEKRKTKAEAERVLYPKTILSAKNFLLINDYVELLSFIDSLQQEQPEVDLEKEIEEHSERMPMSEFTHDSEVEEFVKWAKQEFRHFYELGELNARKEENK